MAKPATSVRPEVAAAEARFTPEEKAYLESGGTTSLGEPTPTEAPTVTQAPAVTAPPETTAAPLAASQALGASPESTVAPEQQKMVPHGALHEERERRKEAEKAKSLAEDRLGQILKKLTEPAAPTVTEAPLADPEKDPAGFLTAVLQHVGQRLQEVEGKVTKSQEATQEQQQIVQIGMRVQALEQEFAANTPDYADALKFVGDGRDKELQFFGITDPAQRSVMLRQEAQQIALQAFQAGQNPAELLYQIAKHRGYQVKTAPAATQAPAVIEAPALSDADKLKQVAAGQQQAVSLSTASGSPPTPKTVEKLLAMSPDQFQKALQDPEWRNLMGT